MRNLKKFLALVLAMMMVMSLMLTVNAKNVEFSDDETITEVFKEDLTVLAGMKVVKGYAGNNEDGQYKPQGDITRAEMAAIVYRLATGDVDDKQTDAYVGASNFLDVKDDAWYAGYVNYCENSRYIAGDGKGYFRPTDKVTGYEALAMLLRAMGYNEPDHDFTGSNWATTVLMTARPNGMLAKVDKTSYASRLSLPATRELVAELAFQTAIRPQVQWTLAFGYQDSPASGVIGNTSGKYPSLGEANFGLTNHNGIVLGNEATGEKATKIGFAVNPTAQEITDVIDADAYVYISTANNATLAFTGDPGKTGLDKFGHKVEVWYDNRGDGKTTVTAGAVVFNDNLPTYAIFDRVEQATLVTSPDAKLDTANNNDATPNENLTEVAEGKGFKTNNVNGAYFNYAFGPMTSAEKKADGTDTTDFTSTIGTNNQAKANTHPLYVLISNSSDKMLDMVISLDLTVTKITQANETTAPYTVGIKTANGAAMGTNSYFGLDADMGTGTTADYINLASKNIVGDSTKELGKRVVAIEVTGTTGTNAGVAAGNATAVSPLTSTYYYQLSELKTVKKLTVVAKDANETLTLSDGSKLERSLLALATDGGFQPAANVKAPASYGEYNFTLDAEGKYIFWEAIPTSTTFVYGTYLDYASDLSTSEYRYPLIGLGLDGKQVQRDVTAYSLQADPTTYKDFGDIKAGDAYDDMPLPKKDANSVIGVPKAGIYVGYLIDEDGVLTYVNGTNDDVVKQATQTDFGSAAITMNASDPNVKLGVKEVYAGGDLYLTNSTQFYLVSGAGTANQKVTPYNGLADLMKGNSSVTIDVSKAYTATTDHATANMYLADTKAGTPGQDTWETVYYTTSKLDYAQDYTQSSKQVDVVFIPEAFVEFTSKDTSGMIFVGDSAATGLVNSGKTAAVQYTVYVNGEEQKLWIAGASADTTTAASSVGAIVDNGDNVFHNLKDTGKKAADGQPIYDVIGFTSAPKVIGLYSDGTGTAVKANFSTASDPNALFRATNYSRQLAFIDTTTDLADGSANLYNVGNAKVKNLDTDAYPGVEDVATLSKAASLTDDEAVAVSCVLNADDASVVDVIYVNAP